MKKKCKNCREWFESDSKIKLFCSDRCQRQNKRREIFEETMRTEYYGGDKEKFIKELKSEVYQIKKKRDYKDLCDKIESKQNLICRK